MLALPVAAQQQDNSTPPQSTQQAPDTNQPKDQKTQPQKKKSTAEENPFPEAQSEAAAHPTQQKDDSSTPEAPTPNGQPASGKSSAAGQNPFPEDQSQKAAHQADGSDAKDNGKSGKTGSDDGFSSSQVHLKGFDPSGDANARSADGAGGTVLSPELGRKDTQVGMFYLQTGDYKGAYARFTEATKVDPGNADAVFGLAEAARKLNHHDEAINNYQLYLSALPNGPKAKDARKALKEMGPPQS